MNKRKRIKLEDFDDEVEYYAALKADLFDLSYDTMITLVKRSDNAFHGKNIVDMNAYKTKYDMYLKGTTVILQSIDRLISKIDSVTTTTTQIEQIYRVVERMKENEEYGTVDTEESDEEE